MQLLPNLVLSRGYGLREKKKILQLKVFLPTQILLTEKGLVALCMTGGRADLCSDSPQMAEEQGTLLAHTALAIAVLRPLAAGLELFRIR